MIPDAAWIVVPEKLPSEIEPWVLQAAEFGKLGDRETRAFVWAMYLLSRLSGQAVVTAIMGVLSGIPGSPEPEIADVTAGFIPFVSAPATGTRSLRAARMDFGGPVAVVDDVSYTFGVLVGLTPPKGAEEIAEGENTTPSQVVSIEEFPIVVEYRRISYSAPPNPVGATAACYVKAQVNKRYYGPRWSDGVVIARHSLSSLGFATGVQVPMTGGQSFPVVDIDGSTTIDAAILDCGSVPSSASSLVLAPAFGPGTNVDVRTAGRQFSAQVLRVNDHPNYFGNLVAHRVFLDKVGASGNSGSLVKTSQGDAVGVYMGSTPGAPPEGIVQSLRQVVKYFEVDLFD